MTEEFKNCPGWDEDISEKQVSSFNKDKSKEKKVCCFCYEEFEGYGNNPDPIKKTGVCCDSCNEKVIFARLNKAFNRKGLEIPVCPTFGGQE